ncbi:hypothetical protein [Thalassobaculum sp.]
MNTLRAIESLTQSGFSEEQARAVVGVVAEVVDDTAATKLDFVELKAAMHTETAEVSRQIGTLEAKLDTTAARLESSIANAKVQMVLYTGAIVAGIATISRLFG